jgi:hypothetical protein
MRSESALEPTAARRSNRIAAQENVHSGGRRPPHGLARQRDSQLLSLLLLTARMRLSKALTGRWLKSARIVDGLDSEWVPIKTIGVGSSKRPRNAAFTLL